MSSNRRAFVFVIGMYGLCFCLVPVFGLINAEHWHKGWQWRTVWIELAGIALLVISWRISRPRSQGRHRARASHPTQPMA